MWGVYIELMGCFLGLGMELVEIEWNLQKMGMNFMELRNMVYVGRLCGSGVLGYQIYKDRVMDKCNCVIGLIVGLYSRLGV